jgi:hypothetical protein
MNAGDPSRPDKRPRRARHIRQANQVAANCPMRRHANQEAAGSMDRQGPLRFPRHLSLGHEQIAPKRQIMSQAVGMPAEADTPAPRNHMSWPTRIEKRRAKSSEEFPDSRFAFHMNLTNVSVR